MKPKIDQYTVARSPSHSEKINKQLFARLTVSHCLKSKGKSFNSMLYTSVIKLILSSSSFQLNVCDPPAIFPFVKNYMY